jgi:hypothetical protein
VRTLSRRSAVQLLPVPAKPTGLSSRVRRTASRRHHDLAFRAFDSLSGSRIMGGSEQTAVTPRMAELRIVSAEQREGGCEV